MPLFLFRCDTDSELHPSDVPESESESTPYCLRARKIVANEEEMLMQTPKRDRKTYYARKKETSSAKVFKEFLQRSAERQREYRKDLTPTRKRSSAIKSAERMRKMRVRRKLEGKVPTKKNTRREMQEKREYWRNCKKRLREKQSLESKAKELYRRRQRYHEKKEKGARRSLTQFYSPKKTAEEFADDIFNQIKLATPRKKRALMNKGIFESQTDKKIVSSVKSSIENLKANRTKKGRKDYYFFVNNIVRKCGVKNRRVQQRLKISEYFWHKACELEQEADVPRFDAMSTDTVKLIHKFYVENAVEVPDKRSMDKNLVSKVLLTEPVDRLHSRFKQSTKINVGRSKFHMLRPRNVLTMDSHTFNSCLCEYCVNLELLLDALKSRSIKLGTKFDAVNMTMCPKSGDYFNLECIKRKCDNCGVKKLQEYVDHLDIADDKKMITYKSWRTQTSKSKLDKTVSRKVLVDVTVSMLEATDELYHQIDKMAEHLFVAKWQREQFNKLRSGDTQGLLVSVSDFAENYRCISQDEVGSAFYNYNQVTLYPTVSYYKCVDCNETVTESMVFISPDLVHDVHAVSKFTDKVSEHIEVVRKIVVHKEVQFTDGCISQFKSKRPFKDVSKRKKLYERAFFGSRHGKNPCDALGGLVKSSAERYVKSRRGIISNAEDLYTYCKENLEDQGQSSKCVHKKRTFFYVDDVERPKPNTEENLKFIPGSRQIQSVRSMGITGTVEHRQLSCFCEGCLWDGNGCDNQEYVHKWETHELTQKIAPKRKASAEEKKRKTSNKKKKGEDHPNIDLPTTGNNKVKGKKTKQKANKIDEIPSSTIYKKNSDLPTTDNKVKGKKTQQKTNKIDEIPSSTINKKDLNKGKTTVKKVAKKFKIPAKIDRQLRRKLTRGDVTLPPNYPRYELIKPILHSMDLQVDYIKEDGNCFFRSISKQTTGSEVHYPDYRKLITLFMECHSGQFSMYVDSEINEHITSMKKNKVWATSAEIFATAALLQRDIYVLAPNEDDEYHWLVFEAKKIKTHNPPRACSCHISLINTSGIHYDRAAAQGRCNCLLSKPPLKGLEEFIRLVIFYAYFTI